MDFRMIRHVFTAGTDAPFIAERHDGRCGGSRYNVNPFLSGIDREIV